MKKKKDGGPSKPPDNSPPPAVRGQDGLYRQCHHGDGCVSTRCAENYLFDRGQGIVWEPMTIGDQPPTYEIYNLSQREGEKKKKKTAMTKRLEALASRTQEEKEKDAMIDSGLTKEEERVIITEWREDMASPEEVGRRWEDPQPAVAVAPKTSAANLPAVDNADKKRVIKRVVPPSPPKSASSPMQVVSQEEEDALLGRPQVKGPKPENGYMSRSTVRYTNSLQGGKDPSLLEK
eukprot:sb/3469322/